jgi:hypothetical protein
VRSNICGSFPRALPVSTEDFGPCPSCGEHKGEMKERPGARFPYYVVCKACGWFTSPYVKLASVAVKIWRDTKIARRK